MLGLSTLAELRLAAYGLLLAAICASYIYTHHEGYEACKAPQVAAQKAQKARDATIDRGAIHEDQQNKGALTAPGGVASSPSPSLPVCQPSRLPARPAARAAQPGPLTAEGSDRGVLPGTQAEPSVDLGPVVQDLTLAGVLRAANGDELWERDVKQAKIAK